MMDEQGFRKSLKRAGKKDHVIDGLVEHIRTFERYLSTEQRLELNKASAKSIRDYSKSPSQSDTKKVMRGLALYFRFIGSDSLANLASGIREGETAKTRREFKLGEFRDVNPDHIARLASVGTVTINDMLDSGATPDNRRKLVRKTGIPVKSILELVKLSDISRLGALKSVRARLYYNAGLDTPDKFAKWEPEKLHRMLVKFVESSGFDGIASLPKEVRNAVAKARQLPKVIQY